MLNANSSSNSTVVQLLQGKSFDDIVRLVEERERKAQSEREGLVQAHTQVLVERERELKFKDTMISKLTLELAFLRRLKFGQSSEQLQGEQRQLFEESVMIDISEVETEIELLAPITSEQRIKRQPKRIALPPNLPSKDVHYELNATCGCGCQMQRMGEDVTKKLDYTAGQFEVINHIRGKWACRSCNTLKQAPVPAQVIDKGMATASLLAHVLVSKYLDHLPLYRQEHIFGRAGVAIPRSTLASWVGKCGVALQPLVGALKQAVLTCTVLHADETPVATLDPGKGKTHRSYIWAYAPAAHESINAVIYDFCESRAGRHAQEFLGDWRGSLVVDDFSGYKQLMKDGIEEVGCMAHARRKFFELFQSNKSPMAQTALKYIQALYMLEREVKDLSAEQRWGIRQSRGKPIANKMHKWLTQHRQTIADNSAASRAMDYTLKRWRVLVRYLDDASLPIDNNKIENAIRPISLGRKNWMFVGSQRAGESAAAIMSLLQSAKLNGHDPYQYLKDVLERLPTQLNSQIAELLPHNWRPMSQEVCI
jgi:transposase